jgi:hypothetical protein
MFLNSGFFQETDWYTMNQYERKVFDFLLGYRGNEAHFNAISSGTNRDKTDTKNTLDSMLEKQIITKRIDGKFTIYKINHDYKDAILMMLEVYESRIKNYEVEIIKSLKYLNDKKLFVRDLKFVNKTIKNNVKGIVRFTKAIIDVASTVAYIEVFMKLDNEQTKTVRDIQKMAFQTARMTTDRLFDEHIKDQPNLSIYLEFEIPILFTNA